MCKLFHDNNRYRGGKEFSFLVGLWQAQGFYPHLIGSVIPFLRIGDAKAVLLAGASKALKDRSKYLKSLALLQDFETKVRFWKTSGARKAGQKSYYVSNTSGMKKGTVNHGTFFGHSNRLSDRYQPGFSGRFLLLRALISHFSMMDTVKLTKAPTAANTVV